MSPACCHESKMKFTCSCSGKFGTEMSWWQGPYLRNLGCWGQHCSCTTIRLGSAASLLPFQVLVPGALPRKHPVRKFPRQHHLLPGSLTPPPLAGQGTVADTLSVSTAKDPCPRDGGVVGLSTHFVVRMKQVNSLKSLRTVPVDNKWSMNAYYELLLWVHFLTGKTFFKKRIHRRSLVA